jgi:WS/DGAT/MGAT family acyltransferase
MFRLRGHASTVAGPRAVIERVGSDDLMQLASDVGPVPWQVGAILLMEAGADFDASAATDMIAERIIAIPRLRQVLVHTPLGCGRPIWVDDADFDVRDHVRSITCEPPGDETALLETAVAVATERLPSYRPLWRATFITGLAGSRTALLVVFHHVLADGIGGLAVLAKLVDGAPTARTVSFPRPAPSRRQLAADAFRARLAVFGRSRAFLSTLRRAVTELNPAGAARAPGTTLNRPTGGQRRLAVTRVSLDRVRDVARAHRATVNDVVLTAITGALGALLARRGESVESLVVSVPVSARTSAGVAELGNRVGAMAVNLPLRRDPIERLERIAAITRAHKMAARGASAALLAPLFRVLAAVRLMRWFTNRQQMVNVFETNLHGPDRPLAFAGIRIADVLPVTSIIGNVAISFAAMSYAGGLTVMIVADPEAQPDLRTLTTLLQQELDDLATACKS